MLSEQSIRREIPNSFMAAHSAITCAVNANFYNRKLVSELDLWYAIFKSRVVDYICMSSVRQRGRMEALSQRKKEYLMLKILMTSDDGSERILDMAETPDIILVKFLDLHLRHGDMNNPDTRRALRDTVTALKAKAEKEPTELVSFDLPSFKAAIDKAEELLKQFDEEFPPDSPV